LAPNDAEAHSNLGISLAQQDRTEEALSSFERAIALKPDFPEAHLNLGFALFKQKRTEEATASYRRALTLRPGYVDAHYKLGSALQALNRLDEAVASFEQVITLQPDHAGAYHNLGNAFREQGRLEESVASFRRALALKPDYTDALNNLGNALTQQGKLDEAIASFERAISIDPNYAMPHNNSGTALLAQGRIAEAKAGYGRALALRPDYALAHFNLSLALLLEGDMAQGAAEYEWRLKTDDQLLPAMDVPSWDGQPLSDKAILLRAEQGFGDTIQFIRYAPLVRARCARVVLQCPGALVRLMATATGVDEVTEAVEPPPGAAAHVPLLSLMHIFATRLETIPADVPYLAADPGRIARFQERIAPAAGLKVGLAWAGSPKHKNDRNRSLTLDVLAPLLLVEGVTFFSLQKGDRAAEIAEGYGQRLIDLGPDLGDFADTAAAMSCLDLVIAVDTAVAHLAGALAVPVWVLLPFAPDWRWLLEREDNPWYPTMRLYRQPAIGDWGAVLHKVADDLQIRAWDTAAIHPPSVADEVSAEAMRERRAGRMEQAQALFRRVLAIEPDHVQALYYLGQAAGRHGDYQTAATLLARAVARAPAYASAHYNLANALQAMGRPEAAVESYRRAVALETNGADAHLGLANTLRGLDRLEEAATSYRRALSLKPDDAEARAGLDAVVGARRQNEAAIPDQRPGPAAAEEAIEHNRHGIALAEAGRLDEAVASFERAVGLRADYAEAHVNLGFARGQQKRCEEAVASYGRALALKPDYVDAHFKLGIALQELGRLDEAVARFERAIALKPDLAAAHNNLAIVFSQQGKLDEAMESIERAISINPNNAMFHNNSATTLLELGRVTEAKASYGQALELEPNNADVHSNFGMALLLTGDFARGSAECEWRWQAEIGPRLPRLEAPSWDGKPLPDKTILLRAEQGFGDTIQFIRYAPLVRARCGRVVLQCPGALLRLMATVAGVDEVMEVVESPTVAAAQAPLLSLMHLFATRLETIPADVPYLAADPGRTARFQERIAPAAGLKVGLAWAGRPKHKNDRNRSLTLDALAPLLGVEGVTFFSLQKDDRAAEITEGYGQRLIDLGPDLGDFADTAAAMSCLDLVIAVDTAVAHLAGALAVPVWVLLPFAPDWRWLLEREDNPWYPTMRLYRQPAIGDWSAVLHRLAADLQARARTPVAIPAPVGDEVFTEAMREHRAGRMEQAQALFRRVLAIEPDHVRALYYLGQAAGRLGDYQTAATLLARAVARAPAYASAHYNLANALQGLGRLEAAVASYRRAVALEPNGADAHLGLANTLRGLDRLEEAATSYRHALSLRPDDAEARAGLDAVVGARRRQNEAAIPDQRPGPAAAEEAIEHNRQGVALVGAGKLDEAVASFERAVGLRADYAEAHVNLGFARSQQKRSEEAVASYGRALALKPDHVDAHFKLGLALQELGRLDEAVASFGRAITLKPDLAAAHNNLGNVLETLGRWDEAAASYRRALALNPKYPGSHSNLGLSLLALGRIEEAEASLRRAVALKPDLAGAHFNLSLALLSKGHFAEGVAEYEWRFKAEDYPSLPAVPAPLWDGQPLPGQTLLLQAEQGYGDAIQFVRYAPLVRALCGRLLLQCAPPLARLMATAEGIDQIGVVTDPPPGVAAHAPLMSLMQLLGTRVETIPATVPYLAADPGRTAAFETRIRSATGLKVGIAWAGSPKHKNDRHRSLSLNAMAPLLAVGGATFFSLQAGPAAGQISSCGSGDQVVDLAPQFGDFADTAAAMSCLDLVITVDTAVAHLAGALAKPVWVLLPFAADWRWLLRREDSPWYPSMRLYRQAAPGDWGSVLQRVALDLQLLALKRPPAVGDASLAHEAFAEAMRHYQAGQSEQADDLLRQVLKADPRHCRAFYYRGLLAGRRGAYQAAESLFREALALAPQYADAHHNLGNALQAQGRLEEAVACYGKAAHLEPAAAEVHLCLATALQGLDRLDEAVANYRRALALAPNNTEAHMSLGRTFQAQNRLEDAVARYRRVVELSPDNAEAHNNLGVALAEQGHGEAGVTSIEKALTLQPDYAAAHNNLGTALAGLDRLVEAAASYRRAIALDPRFATAFSSLANVLRKLGKVEEAKTCIDRALALDPKHAGAHNNSGVMLEAEGSIAAAIESYQRAVELEPQNAPARFNLSLALMLNGDLARGAAEYECRWRAIKFAPQPKLSAPAWDGNPRPGQSILLWAEQGFGDAIQFVRYAPLVRARCGRVVLQCAPSLTRLLVTAAGVDEVTAAAEPPAGIAAHAPLMSLMHILGTTLETIPADVPYLTVDPARAAMYHERIGTAAGLKVGLAWAGSPAHKKDHKRSLALSALAPLLAVDGVTFFSLQKGGRVSDIAACGFADRLVDLGSHLGDFADTAAAMSSLDLVISVDTAIVHLAGALARPVWTLLPFVPDWRWLLQREDTPWYPTMHLYRQPALGDWAAVVERVTADLRSRVLEECTAVRANLTVTSEAFAEAMRHQRSGGFEEAEVLFGKVVAAEPNHVRGLYYLGLAAGRRGDYEAAESLLRRAVGLAPGYANAHYNLANTLEARHQLEGAVESYRRTIQLEPKAAEAHLGLANALRQQERLKEAADSYQAAIACNPEHAETHNDLGNVFQMLGRLDEAVARFEQAIALKPDYAGAHYNLGNALGAQDHWGAAEASYRRAIEIVPNYVQAHNNLGNLLTRQLRLTEALSLFEHGLALEPQNAELHNNLGIALLLKGDFGRGAAEYEWRFRAGDLKPPPAVKAPAWDGRPLPGQTLLLQAEQGYGDAIQFIRYAPLVRARCGRLILQCAQPLGRLLATTAGIDEVTSIVEPPAGVAAHAPLLSLMHLFGTRLETVPASVPYLAADSLRVGAFETLVGSPGCLKIGLAWAGSPGHKNDRNRSLSLSALEPVLATENVRFFSLQKGDRAREILTTGFADRLVDLDPHLGDFADTAAAVSCMDLVISVDTAVAHLAGALGKPVWVLLPFASEWRWMLEREDSPWYPTMRLFRQSRPRLWEDVVQRVATALRTVVAQTSTIGSPSSVLSGNPKAMLAEAVEHHRAGRLPDAEALYRRVLAIDPDNVHALHHLGVAAGQQAKYEVAEQLIGRALAISPHCAEAHYNLGNALEAQDRIEEASASYQRTLAINPDYAAAMNNLGVTLQAQNRVHEALKIYAQALALESDNAGVHYNLGMALLLTGEFARGTAECEWRWQAAMGPRLPTVEPPVWDGQPLPDKAILLRAEQGFGDTIQFIRYAPFVKARCGRVIVQCVVPLMPLLAAMPGVDEVIAFDDTLPAIAAHAPLLSLMHILETRLDTIPATVPYLAVDASRAVAFKQRIATQMGLKVGLVWAGNPNKRTDHIRSLSLSTLAPILALPGITFFSLQKGPRAAELAASPAGTRIIDLAPYLNDFADTAAAMSCFDLVISVDTAVAHLAGALAKPVWTLLPFAPDWRWLLDRDDSPWYPTMRLFRQPYRGDWASVVAYAANELRLHHSGRARPVDAKGGTLKPFRMREAPEKALPF
jgi:tetratricopeptide (TPR) repeat protein